MKYVLVVIFFYCFYCKCFCQSNSFFIKHSKELDSKFYLMTKMLNDTIIFFSLNTEFNCNSSSIFGVAIKDSKNIFQSSKLYNNIIESYAYLDSSLFNTPSNTILFLDFGKKNSCYLSGVNTSLLFGHSSKVSGKYSIFKSKKKSVFECKSDDAIGAYRYEKNDTILIQAFESPHTLFKIKDVTLRKGDIIYYFPFYVNGFIPFWSLSIGIFWIKSSDLNKYSLRLKL